MSALDPATSSPADATNRRRSGRIVQKPLLYSKDPKIATPTNGVAKRKRAERVDGESQESEDEVEDEASSEDEPTEETLNERKKKAKKAPSRKPATKRVKTTRPESMKLAMRPAVNGTKKASKPRSKKPRARVTMPAGEEATGLYAEVFLQNSSIDDVAANWIERYKEHNTNAMCDLINFVLKCTGCEAQVNEDDIGDPDHAPERLTELQEEYQSKQITDYPLILRAKGNAFSRQSLDEFIELLMLTAHASGILSDDAVFIENVLVWVTAMSSSIIRPFRHTATVILIAIATAMCKIMKEIANSNATTTRQKENEQKRKNANKERVAGLKEKIEENEAKRKEAEKWLLDIFDTVFVNRYRDVDPRIRADCTAALGSWILIVPDIMFEGSYLRYLGWLLSDHQQQVRLEVVKQLLRLYHDSENLGRLRAFTERFRPRMVEVAAQDAEPGIRALAVELLDEIREMGLLEPDDIDSIGRLIFDAESKVRKAIAPFFAASVKDSYEAVIEELGGDDGLEDAIGEEAENDHESPHRIWLKFKCIAELLDSYDFEDSQDGTPAPGVESLMHWANAETRYTMAAEVVYEGLNEMKDWEMLAGYLLYDISTPTSSRTRNDPLETFKQRCQLTEKQEKLLLEVLNISAKMRLNEAVASETSKRGRQNKIKANESREIQEHTASNLAQFLPQLLRKFGANPAAASTVLRLGKILDLEVFHELRQDSKDFDALLEDINKQFLSHADRNVLAEASSALLHASTFEELEEVTESKRQELWDKTTAALRQTMGAKTPQMKSIANTVHRILRLSNISDPSEHFLKKPRSSQTTKSQKNMTVVELLIHLVEDYANVEDVDAEVIIINATNALVAFYMWTARSIQENADIDEAPEEVPFRETATSAMLGLIDQRSKLDAARLSVIGTLLELHTLFATFRQNRAQDAQVSEALSELAQEVPAKGQDEILSSFIAAERYYAKKTHRTLEETADDELPDAPMSESEDESDEDEDEDESEKMRRRQAVLLAEKQLCELTGKMVLAIVARVIDASGEKKGEIRKRLLRNKLKLGNNFKDVLAYLDEPKPNRRGSKAAKPKADGKTAAAAAAKNAPAAKSAEVVVEEDDDEEDENEEVEEGGEEDLRRRELVDQLPEDEIGEEEEEEEERAGGLNGEQGGSRANGSEEGEDDIMGD